MGEVKTHAFRQAFEVSKQLLQWYPGHMGKGMTTMQRMLKSVDCVVEVHDARVALSGRNPNFMKKLLGVKPHILVLNKVDMIGSLEKERVRKKVESEGIENLIFTNCRQHYSSGVKSVVPRAVELVKKSPRYNRAENTDLAMLVIGIPNVGKSSLINALRIINTNRGKATAVGPHAGVTTSVMNRIKVSVNPDMYLIDTPGILPPSITNKEAGMKLALCACFKDDIVGNTTIADFFLYWCNKNNEFSYVTELNLDEPTDDIILVLKKLATDFKLVKRVKDLKSNSLKTILDIDAAAKIMVKKFREGDFGLFNLDRDLMT